MYLLIRQLLDKYVKQSTEQAAHREIFKDVD